VTFRDYAAHDDALVDRATDHCVITATASIPR